jgi:hypothetical protein
LMSAGRWYEEAGLSVVEGEPRNGTACRVPRWPKLHGDAYHGLVGRVVRAIEPVSEADPVAILVTFLSAFGNAIGRNSYARVGPSRHYAKINAALVGETSKGRKGMSWGYVKAIMHVAERYWTEERYANGLSSGEGLIYQVRDRVMGTDKEGNEVVTDVGAEDKRLFVVEEEFATVLKMATREGNILSAVLRACWDDARLATLTKNSPLKATESHVSIIGHVTKTELVRLLAEADAHNGFANRFLWVCVRRSKALPFGGDWDGLDVASLVSELGEVLRFAKSGGVRWGNTAKPLWEDRYEALSEGAPGLFGAVTSRAEAQTLRLATVYALMDGTWFIEEEHLKAALALWDYCEASARYVFGNATGDPVADRIEAELEAEPDGLTKTDLSHLFKRNKSSEEIERSLSLLERHGRIIKRTESTGGRPAERWFLDG